MNGRRLQAEITIERKARTVSPAGTVSEAWQPLAVVRAEALHRKLNERLQDFGEAEELSIGFRLRTVPGVEITTADRVRHAGAALNIVDVIETRSGRARIIELVCKRMAP